MTWNIAFGITLGVIILYLLMAIIGGPLRYASDFTELCQNHKGVKNIKDNTWSGNTTQDYFVICKDGVVKGID